MICTKPKPLNDNACGYLDMSNENMELSQPEQEEACEKI
jgi:hypothetical protein